MKEELTTVPNQELTVFSTTYFDKFVEYTDVKDTTIQGYKVGIRRFALWLQENEIPQPVRDDIRAYKRFLQEQGFSAGTQYQYLRAVKHFFKWASSEGLYPNIADNIKGAKVRADNTKKESFAAEDIKTVLESIDTTTETGKRNYAMILLSVTAGLRIIEMQRANICDLQKIRGQQVLYIQGKGHDEKDDYVKIIPEVAQAISEYLKSRKPYKKKDPLFTSTSNHGYGQRLSEPSISRTIKETFKVAGYDCEKLTAHSLRHTSNTLLFKAGEDLYTVQKHARHQNPATTEIYIHSLDKEKRQGEQKVFDQIFHPDKQDIARQAYDILQTLSEQQQQQTLEFIKKLKKGD